MRVATKILILSSLGLAAAAGCGKDKEETESRDKKATGSGTGSASASDTGSATGSASTAAVGALDGDWLSSCIDGGGGAWSGISIHFDLAKGEYDMISARYADEKCSEEISARTELGLVTTTGDGKGKLAAIDLKPLDIAQRYSRQSEVDTAIAGKNCGRDDWKISTPISIDGTPCSTLSADGKILGAFLLGVELQLAIDLAKPGDRPKDVKDGITYSRK